MSRVGEERREVERDPRVDEEDRHEEPEGDGLDLALDHLGVALRGVAHEQPPDDAGRERTQQHVEVEHDAERDERERIRKTTRIANWPEVCRVELTTRCIAPPAPRAASQIATPATSANRRARWRR